MNRSPGVSLLAPAAVAAVALLAPAPAAAQARPLTVEWIMQGPALVGREPSDVRWSADGQWIYFRWLPPGSAWDLPLKPYRVQARAGSTPEPLTVAQADSAAPFMAEGPVDLGGRVRAVSVEGDLWLVDRRSGRAERLTQTAAPETPLLFAPDGRTLYFRRDDNVFALALGGGSGLTRQLTDIRSGPAPDSAAQSLALPTGQRGFVAGDELRLLRAVQDQRVRDSVSRAEREAREALRPKPLYLGRGERVQQVQPSPSGAHLLLITTTAPEDRNVKVPNYVTRSGYTEELETRAKVGDTQPRRRAGLIEAASGRVTWLAPDLADSTATTFPRLSGAGWNDAGTSALLWSVSHDYTTRHLQRVDAESGRLSSVDVLRDTAWVGGPCFGCAGWLPGERGIWFVSEADGWAHLYVTAPDGSGRRQLTTGRWEVLRAELSGDRQSFELTTSEASLYERQVYRMPLDGGPRVRLSGPAGAHDAVTSPDGRQLAVVHSTANRPPELYLQAARPGAELVPLTTSPTAEWLALPWIEPEIITIPASDGVPVPARIYRPAQVGAAPNGAAVIFVHGAGYLHNVHRYWSSYYREYMFHHLLAQRGYLVLDLDYRGSAGYGRDWRTAIYRHMGGRDLQDQVDAVRWLQRTAGIAPDRVGIYGGSYGGFITLMALFTESRWFGAGAALRPVTDWAHYNHPYTAAILNEPPDDSVAYRRSSPIYFAEGLEDPLVIAHGMVDVNVHFQDVVRLAQRLIELGKTDWELAPYPVENHGFVRPDSWTDEYRRILSLFERALRRPGP